MSKWQQWWDNGRVIVYFIVIAVVGVLGAVTYAVQQEKEEGFDPYTKEPSSVILEDGGETFGSLRIDVNPEGTILCVRSRTPDAMQCWIREDASEAEDDVGLRNTQREGA